MEHEAPQALVEPAGLSDQMIEDRFVEVGQGMQSMSPASRDLEQILIEGQLAARQPSGAGTRAATS